MSAQAFMIAILSLSMAISAYLYDVAHIQLQKCLDDDGF